MCTILATYHSIEQQSFWILMQAAVHHTTIVVKQEYVFGIKLATLWIKAFIT